MERISKNVYCKVFNVTKRCNMDVFSEQRITGFKAEMGYGYYEFKEEEYLKPQKNVILMHKVNIKGYIYTHAHAFM